MNQYCRNSWVTFTALMSSKYEIWPNFLPLSIINIKYLAYKLLWLRRIFRIFTILTCASRIFRNRFKYLAINIYQVTNSGNLAKIDFSSTILSLFIYNNRCEYWKRCSPIIYWFNRIPFIEINAKFSHLDYNWAILTAESMLKAAASTWSPFLGPRHPTSVRLHPPWFRIRNLSK